MNVLVTILAVAPPTVAAFFLGYVVGRGRGEDEGYRLGYHEGDFDATHLRQRAA